MPQATLIQSDVAPGSKNCLTLGCDAVMLPKLSTAGRLALSPSGSQKGLLVYDTTTGTIYTWDGANWSTPGGASYSDGTWLAQLIPAVGTITEDPAVKTGYWSLVGKTVTISMKIRVQSIAGGPTGLLRLVTLPYPAVQETAVSVTTDLLQNGAKTSVMGYATGSDINLYHYENGNLNALSQHVPAGGVFWISGSYLTP